MRIEIDRFPHNDCRALRIYRAAGPLLLRLTWGRQWHGRSPKVTHSTSMTFLRRLRIAFGIRFGLELNFGPGGMAGRVHPVSRRSGFTAYFAFRGRGNGRPDGFHVLVPMRAGITTNANTVPLF